MKKVVSFWESLEKYGWKTIGRSPLPLYWPWIGVVIVIMVIIASVANAKNSVAGTTNYREVVWRAAKRGDYELARELLTNQQTNETTEELVLRAESELEDKVYPEQKVERRIVELENKLEEYPVNKQIYLMLADLYMQLQGTRVDAGVDPYKDMADEYREKARVLDPNGVEFR